MQKIALSCLAGVLALSASAPAGAGEAANFTEMFTQGDAGLAFRYRFENVDQDGFEKDATASTLLSKLWYKTASLKGISGFAEVTNVTVVGDENYNNTINGKTDRPVVADPESTEVNQAYLAYTQDLFTLKAGRIGVNLDNQRFIGTVGFRQNDQTYDIVTATVTPIKELTALYGYVWNVNRIFSDDHPLGDLDTNTHLINVSYSGLEFGKLTAYAYLLDLNDAPVLGLSSSTYGVRFAGAQAVTDTVRLGYELEYARQSDYEDNPAEYQADYWNAALSVSTAGFTAGFGYELLGSDNGVSFQTPLATLHKFNGWADKFLSTPAQGLEDISVSLAYKMMGEGPLAGLLLKGIYHDFSSDVGGVSYGSEWDFLVSKPFAKHYTASVKAAFYEADAFATDTTKIWLTLAAKF
ncbi:alginate export family protein [Luteithermobacter gelatinilyticus]|uniref:alginate export family protein n=1 Tax=Luteithermobacter gelatinilyticus TaxID=2582913 RepID=UPI001105D0D4|nr:alginate export family protein [Luteithermobacter gelatinilyticus]